MVVGFIKRNWKAKGGSREREGVETRGCSSDCKNGKSLELSLGLNINTTIATSLMFNSHLALPLNNNSLV
jgi:hypothetical protein